MLVDLKNSMPNKKAKHNHKEDLGCVPRPYLKGCHKTSKLVQIIYLPACALLEIIEQWNIYISRHSSTIKYRCSSHWQPYLQNLEGGW